MIGCVGYFVGLIFVFIILWLGFFWDYFLKMVIVLFGVVFILLFVILVYWFDIFDCEGFFYVWFFNLMVYWVWLMVEIFKVNWVVIKVCL